MSLKKIIKNQQGILTIDFLVASVIVFAFSAILFSFAITLSVAEVIQYISYSSARNYSLAHANETKQRERAQLKFDQLSNNPAIQPMINSGWFKIAPAIISDFNNEYGSSSSDDSDIFVGVRIPMSAPILYKRIPMLGTTSSDPEGFTANIHSFLAREPNFNECESFITERANAILNLNLQIDVSATAVMMDNGC